LPAGHLHDEVDAAADHQPNGAGVMHGGRSTQAGQWCLCSVRHFGSAARHGMGNLPPTSAYRPGGMSIVRACAGKGKQSGRNQGNRCLDWSPMARWQSPTPTRRDVIQPRCQFRRLGAGEGTAMASLEVCALVRAAVAWLPGGAAGCVRGCYPVAGQAASGPVSPMRSRAPPRAIPASSQPTVADSRVLRGRRRSCPINSLPDQSRQADAEDPLP
jgi:hypothetical protein